MKGVEASRWVNAPQTLAFSPSPFPLLSLSFSYSLWYFLPTPLHNQILPPLPPSPTLVPSHYPLSITLAPSLSLYFFWNFARCMYVSGCLFKGRCQSCAASSPASSGRDRILVVSLLRPPLSLLSRSARMNPFRNSLSHPTHTHARSPLHACTHAEGPDCSSVESVRPSASSARSASLAQRSAHHLSWTRSRVIVLGLGP